MITSFGALVTDSREVFVCSVPFEALLPDLSTVSKVCLDAAHKCGDINRQNI